MTAQEWLASNDPATMLDYLLTRPRVVGDNPGPPPSERKLRLFAVACCRQVWDGVYCQQCAGLGGHVRVDGEDRAEPANAMSQADYVGGRRDEWRRTTRTSWAPCPDCHGTGNVGGLTDPRSRRAVEVAERYADGLATEVEREAAYDLAIECAHEDSEQVACMRAAYSCCNPDAMVATRDVVGQRIVPPATQAALLREVFGNPFRPVKLLMVHRCTKCNWNGEGPNRKYCDFGDDPHGKYEHQWKQQCPWLRWNDGTVPRIAQGIYDERRWGDMPILADALTDAGCDDDTLLAHCREPMHVRGCWVLDLILGRS